MKTYKIVMKSAGGVKHDLETGFESESHAISVANNMDWVYVDENEFEWYLDVEEEYCQ